MYINLWIVQSDIIIISLNNDVFNISSWGGKFNRAEEAFIGLCKLLQELMTAWIGSRLGFDRFYINDIIIYYD